MHSSKAVKTHQPCPVCPSSDAFTLYDDGHGYCFSCNSYVYRKDNGVKMNTDSGVEQDDMNVEYGTFPFRGIDSDTLKKFGVVVKRDADTKELLEVGFPYTDTAYKVRSLRQKKFRWKGSGVPDCTLFGKNVFPPGSARAITITEGEIDALSVYQMMGDYPVVSVRSASSAKSDCAKEHEYLDSFEKIYICFDNDEPGKKAAQEVASLFDFNKVYYVRLDHAKYKDANDYLVNGEEKTFRNLWYNARRYLPDNIVSSLSDFRNILESVSERPRIPYPWPDLQEKTYGIAPGEIVLMSALEGIGKTEFMRALEYHVLKNTDDNIGIIHLEETPHRTLKGLAGLELGFPCHFPDSPATNEDVLKALERLNGPNGERIHIYSHYGSEDSSVILNNIRFLVSACNCKYIFFDHITMVVTGNDSSDERKELDYLSTQLGMLVKELDFSLIMISHENDSGQTRGSRNISKIADLHVRLLRDPKAENEIERNTTQLLVVKNRFGAVTGPSDKLFFDRKTFKLEPLVEEVDETGIPKLDNDKVDNDGNL